MDLWYLLELIIARASLLLRAVLNYVNEPLSMLTHSFIDLFEAALPQQAGRIRRSPADLFIFLVYILMLTVASGYALHALQLRLRRLCRCRWKRKLREVQLYRQEVPVAPQLPVRPAWLESDLPKPRPQSVCCFDLWGF